MSTSPHRSGTESRTGGCLQLFLHHFVKTTSSCSNASQIPSREGVDAARHHQLGRLHPPHRLHPPPCCQVLAHFSTNSQFSFHRSPPPLLQLQSLEREPVSAAGAKVHARARKFREEEKVKELFFFCFKKTERENINYKAPGRYM